MPEWRCYSAGSELNLKPLWFGANVISAEVPWNAASYQVRVNISFEESITGTPPPESAPGRNGPTMNNEPLSGTQLSFIEQSSQYEASFTELYCVTQDHQEARQSPHTKRHTFRDDASIDATRSASGTFHRAHSRHPGRGRTHFSIYLQHFYGQPFTFSAELVMKVPPARSKISFLEPRLICKHKATATW